MTSYIALLRAVNVGGTGKLLMTDLKALCERAGCEQVQTYIASGNVAFGSELSEAEVRSTLEASLAAWMGKPIGVLVRTAAEITAVLKANPFPAAAPNRTVAIFLQQPPPGNALATVTGQNGEEIRLGVREIYVHYGQNMADSKLKIPIAQLGTARNLNTVAKLSVLANKIRTGPVA
jgi:uncharacterized protein (DUF1697 family)